MKLVAGQRTDHERAHLFVFVDVRNIIEKDVVQYGGRYTADLLKNQTTHLICDFGVGNKYRSAVSWGGIKCVTINWFKDTIKTLGKDLGCASHCKEICARRRR